MSKILLDFARFVDMHRHLCVDQPLGNYTSAGSEENSSLSAILAANNVDANDFFGFSAFFLAETPEMRQLLARAWPQNHPLRLHVLAAANLADEVSNAIGHADMDIRDERGQSPLFYAIQKNSLSAAKILIKAGADVTARDNFGQITLDLTESLEMRQILARVWPQSDLCRLHALAAADLAAEVADAVAAGADVNARDDRGRTPLFRAIQNDSLVAAEVLVKAGADIAAFGQGFHIYLDRTRSPEMRQLLARAWPQDHPLRLHALVKADLADEVADAVAAGADVNARDEWGRTPLFLTVQQNRAVLLCSTLIDANADIETRDSEGNTPFLGAVMNDNVEMAEMLLRAGAEATVQNQRGQIALDLAESLEMCRLVAGVWPENHRFYVRALATADLGDDIINAIAAGKLFDSRDEWGRSPLHWAVMNNCLVVVEILIEAGADISLRDNRLQTLMDMAKTKEMRKLIQKISE